MTDNQPTLQVITASTRNGRSGPLVADWFLNYARKNAQFIIEPIDLAAISLPMYNEPRHPRLKQYEYDHTKAWSAIVNRADAFVIVTPEYNYFAPPALINALDYLSHEWAYKPVGFVSYGGISGGTRSVQSVKPLLTTLQMVPLPVAVSIPFFNQYIKADSGTFDPGEIQEKAAEAMLNELLRWAKALKPLRA